MNFRCFLLFLDVTQTCQGKDKDAARDEELDIGVLMVFLP